MRIAVLADIHANLPALEAVLVDVKTLSPDWIVVNGDFINRGPSNPQVIERLWALQQEYPQKLWFTLGNHDDLMLGWAKGDSSFQDLYDEPLFSSMGWAAAQLETTHLDWLSTLPFQVALRGWGMFGLGRSEGMGQAVDMRITHGSPRHYREGYDEHQALDVLGEIADDFPARLLVGSHTHRNFRYQLGHTLILNSGAVGAPFNGDTRAQYAVVELDSHSLEVNFRQIPYRLEAALQDFHRSGMLADGGLGAELFYLELQHGRSYLTPFYMWALQEERPRDRSSWAVFQQRFPERFA